MYDYQAVYQDLWHLSELARDMRKRGLLVDTAARARHEGNLQRTIRCCQKAWRRLVPDEQYYCGATGTGHNLRRLFFGLLGCQVLVHSKTDGSPSLDSWTLQQFRLGRGVPTDPRLRKYARLLALVLLKLRKASKLFTTYIKKLPVRNGRVFPVWKVHGAITGRWACAAPNMQNIPKNKGLNLRDLIVADPGQVFVGADYDKLELRIIAILSEDQPLLDAFALGIDVHRANACDLYQVQTPTDAQRDFAKTFVYAVNYGAADETVYDNLVVNYPALTLALVTRLKKNWFHKHRAITAWHAKVRRQAMRDKAIQVPVPGGRFEEFPDGKVDANKVINFPVQGVGGYLANRAILEIQRACAADPTLGTVVLQVHDEITGMGPDAARLGKVIQTAMSRPVQLCGKEWVFPVDLKAGPVWGTMAKLKV